MRKDYYKSLQVPRDATPQEVKKAFYRLAHRWHPDKNPGDPAAEDRFKEINEAYSVLSDPSRKVKYDLFGRDSTPLRLPEIDLDSMPVRAFLLRKIFGAAGLRFSEDAGPDVGINLQISLEEAAGGTVRRAFYTRRAPCPQCLGTGENGRRLPPVCPGCGGSGTAPMMFGIEGLERLCPTCRGNSYTIKNPCRKCRGTGTVQTSEHAQVSVPAGIEEGMEIRVHGAGNYSRGHGTGDLVATASLRIHPVFRKNGLDLSCEIVVGTAEARQGSSVEVPGLGSGFRLQIPPNTRPGQTFRIKGGGLPGTAGERGDLHVRITTG